MNRIIFEKNGVAAILIPSPNWKGTIEALAAKDVPEGVAFDIVDVSVISSDRTFRNAWQHDTQAKGIKTDMPKAKLIAHDLRRVKRAEELAPLDIEATIPSKASAAEAARVIIRTKYETMQTDIDSASNEAALKQLLVDGGVL